MFSARANERRLHFCLSRFMRFAPVGAWPYKGRTLVILFERSRPTMSNEQCNNGRDNLTVTNDAGTSRGLTGRYMPCSIVGPQEYVGKGIFRICTESCPRGTIYHLTGDSSSRIGRTPRSSSLS